MYKYEMNVSHKRSSLNRNVMPYRESTTLVQSESLDTVSGTHVDVLYQLWARCFVCTLTKLHLHSGYNLQLLLQKMIENCCNFVTH